MKSFKEYNEQLDEMKKYKTEPLKNKKMDDVLLNKFKKDETNFLKQLNFKEREAIVFHLSGGHYRSKELMDKDIVGYYKNRLTSQVDEANKYDISDWPSDGIDDLLNMDLVDLKGGKDYEIKHKGNKVTLITKNAKADKAVKHLFDR